MRRGGGRALLAAALLAKLPGVAAAAEVPELGSWLTANRQAVVTVAPCGSGICGRLAGLTPPHPGAVVRDVWNRPECGETILDLPRRGADGHWHGTVTDPRDGARYRAELFRAGAGLVLRGFVLLPALGQSQTWTKFAGTIGPDCAFRP